jgi:DNA-binding response OmpR family regulator
MGHWRSVFASTRAGQIIVLNRILGDSAKDDEIAALASVFSSPWFYGAFTCCLCLTAILFPTTEVSARNATMQVLFYSDNDVLARLLRAALDPTNTVHWVTDERQFDVALEASAMAAIVLDAGFVAEAEAMCLALRTRTAVPLLALAAGADAGERVALLRAGADDALAQPISPQELAARLRAKLRRAMPDQRPPAASIGRERQLTVGDQRVRFSSSELRLLLALQQCNGGYVSAGELARALWQTEIRLERLHFHIWRLRRRLAALGDHLRIETRHGHGYRLVDGRA